MGFSTKGDSQPYNFHSHIFSFFLEDCKIEDTILFIFHDGTINQDKKGKNRNKKKKRREKHIFFNFLLILFYLDILHNTCLRGGIPTYTIFIPNFLFFYEDCKIEGTSLGTINQDKKNKKKKRRKKGCVFFFSFFFYFILFRHPP